MSSPARPLAMVNQLTDAIVIELKKIGVDDPSKWLSAPTGVRVLNSRSDMEQAFPFLVVFCTGWKDDVIDLSMSHKAKATITIVGNTQAPTRVHAAIHELMADVIRALTDAEELGTLLFDGEQGPNSYEVAIEIDGSGRATGWLTVDLLFDWNHGAP